MPTINPTYYNRVRYSLRNSELGFKRILEPKGWNEDEKKFKRSASHGVFTNLTSDLKFHNGSLTFPNGTVIDGGFSYVKDVYTYQGINATILLIKEEKDPQTNKWIEAYRGYLFFPSPMVIENKEISIKFKESSFYNSLLARKNEKIELERLDTIDGDVISPLSTELIALNGRNIFLKSLLEVSEINRLSDNFRMSGSSGHKEGQLAVPITIVSESDTHIQTVFNNQFKDENNLIDTEASTVFYNNSTSQKTLSIKISMNTRVTVEKMDASDKIVRVDLAKYGNGVNYDLLIRNILYTVPDPTNMQNHIIDFTYENDITLNIGESLSLQWYAEGDFSGTILDPNDHIELNFNDTICLVDVKENSFDDNANKQSKMVMPFEALQRIVHVTTGEENALVSNFLGRTDTTPVYQQDGIGNDACFSGIAHGHWIRAFDAVSEDDENKYKPLSISFKQFNEAFGSIWNTGYGIERTGLKENLRFEEQKYFYPKIVTLTLPIQASKVKRTVASKYIYNSLEIGCSKPDGDNLYEEAMGLDETNVVNKSTTPIIPIENNYKKVSPLRTDSYGVELAARKSIKTNPTEDTRFDNNLWMFDNKRGLTDVYEQRLWGDDFEKEPTGIYSPSTVTNLRYSPANIRTRHGWWIRSGMNIYKDLFVKFASSVGNSKLSTQLIGEKEISENGEIQVKDFESPYFEPWIVEFEHEATTSILKQLQGKTLFEGNNIMNYTGLIEFINEDGNYEYGYLLELQPNKEGKWKLLKSSKRVSKRNVQGGINKQITAPSNLEVVDIN